MQWKAHIIVMHEERQKKWVFDQVTGTSFHDSRPSKGPSTTASSHNKTGGATSSSPAKPTSNAAPHNASSGKWTMYAGRGEPMDISMLRREVTSCLPTHSNIPRNIVSPAFNVSRTTSTPVLESQNRYAALTVKECNNNNNNMTLKGSNDGSPTRAQAKVVKPAGHGAESPSTLPDIEANRLTDSSRQETR
ncbi:hypothetical protein ARMSODRAFT_1026657 [Armillaria solidipes]|uniref:Uncharacterized protein n=1 Tax=Armillaria solidipes TaxID=1076256 RepID=A0A2H3AU60_9AGAR|nr:hypothetical protein ARMSODRAFT_1026657 [Armillaria solidipes]